MWQLDNRTPYAADHTWIRDADGAEIWIVSVKATYELLPDGGTCVAAYQAPVNSGLVMHEDGKSPLFETDLGPPKNATDVWLVGHAHSQSGEPIQRMRAGFAVGSIAREIQVIGDREWRGFLRTGPSEPQPFTRMPLTWARALGGNGPDCSTGNPVGCGITKEEDGGRPLPNLEHISRPQGSLIASTTTQGLGPVPRHWPLRRQYAGTYDDDWKKNRAPLQAADLDPRHWQVAPKEQQASGHLRGGEALMLRGLTVAGFAPSGIYHSILPKLSLAFKTLFYDGSVADARSVIHNVILQPDGVGGSGPLVSVVHHMSLPCHDKVNKLQSTIITEKHRPLDHPKLQQRTYHASQRSAIAIESEQA
ncbi:DUF2169 family type VI secretion system accessory protein [Massilia aquatica]|uniref:DUF2169 domain-containing protein n=1 Tax=Massilia aquatica TaxID=2609000 RepID=A0ABX0M406_9BURK|nr:DUF2169 domain-containing protein [Massilia aquatica]NHZ38962.1 DUF2169 domain-containing protein [Massilia aquatica]